MKDNKYELSYTRRRYGTTTYTWVSVLLGGEWVELGDPWPAVRPKMAEILKAVEKVRNLS